MTAPLRIHHVALTVGDGEADRRFHVDLLGFALIEEQQASLVRRVFGTGDLQPGTRIVTLRPTAVTTTGRRGSNGPRVVNLSAPVAALEFWRRRLFDAHVASTGEERLGLERIRFQHPDGVEYAIVGDDADDRRVSARGDIPAESAIRGLHSVTISQMDVREMSEFLTGVLGARHTIQDVADGLYVLADAGLPANRVELLHEPYAAPGTWRYGIGTLHHIALDAGLAAERLEIVQRVRAAGYLDISDATGDESFRAVWLRAPGGTLMGFTCSANGGSP